MSKINKENPVASCEETYGSITKIPQEKRADFLPRFFPGTQAFFFEQSVFSFMSRLNENYHGGMWDFYEITTSAGVKAPLMVLESDEEQVASRGLFGDLEIKTTPRALSVAVNVFALSYIMEKANEQPHAGDADANLYYALNNFIYSDEGTYKGDVQELTADERSAIFSLTD